MSLVQERAQFCEQRDDPRAPAGRCSVLGLCTIKWSTKQVICHIADFEPVYVDRMKRVIAEHEPTLLSGDPDLFAARLAYDQRDVAVELDFIEAARKHMEPILRSLRPEDFLRQGNHSEAGPITLEKLLTNITNHIPHHVKFIEEKRAALK